jgi:hypothetical protein
MRNAALATGDAFAVRIAGSAAERVVVPETAVRSGEELEIRSGR